MERNKMFRTESLNVAAYLIARGFEVKDKEEYGRKATLYFERSDELYNTIKDYNKDENLKKFISAFRELKMFLKEN